MLAAVALGRTVVVADVHLRKVVRAFPFTYPVLDIAFAPDGRWVAASTSDATLRIIDIPSAQVVEHVRFRAPIAACAFHPNGAFLLTAHTHAPGAHPGALFAWANKFLFDSSFTRPILRDSEPVDIEDHEGDADGAQNGPDEEDLEARVKKSSQEPLAAGSLTMSNVPKSKWENMLRLEEIKERNKPQQPAKKPKEAPFFLPTTYDGVMPVFDTSAADLEPEDFFAVKVGPRPGDEQVPLVKLLRAASYDDALGLLQKTTDSGVHLAILEVGPLAGGTQEDLAHLLAFLLHHVRSGREADYVQTLVALVLQLHADDLRGSRFAPALEELAAAEEALWMAHEDNSQQCQLYLRVLSQIGLEG
jgi:U3 small nucleolar RNA-associated protein 21